MSEEQILRWVNDNCDIKDGIFSEEIPTNVISERQNRLDEITVAAIHIASLTKYLITMIVIMPMVKMLPGLSSEFRMDTERFDTERFIDEMEKRPALWDVQSAESKNREKKVNFGKNWWNC
ncbi:uncharacterized protein LOC142322239 [Lycorma delicatula]|uniref:uncharacterized protein LOC142322239 n=1 Tax=Lycorma delicatula TaxID=130591 RepID=UPI003F50F3B4